jgi:hypothetical protein
MTSHAHATSISPTPHTSPAGPFPVAGPAGPAGRAPAAPAALGAGAFAKAGPAAPVRSTRVPRT